MTSINISNPGEKLSPGKLILRFLLAFIALAVLRVRWEIGAGLETDNFIIDNLSKLSNQFYSDGLTDLFLISALFVLVSFCFKDKCCPDRWTLLLAFIFAVFYIIGKVCLNLGSFSFFTANLYQLFLTLLLIVGYTVLFYSALYMLFHFMEQCNHVDEKALRHPVRNAAITMFLCWLPWMLANYPASFCPDSTGQLAQWLGANSWSAHHPPFSTCIMGIFVSLGDFIWNRNFGAFLYLLFQSTCSALVFSLSLATLYKMGMSRRLWVALILFFAANPFWGCFMQWFEKDLLYAVSFCLALTLLLPVLKERRCSGREAIYITCACTAAILLRKTGTYELLPALLAIGLWLKKADRRRLLAATLAIFLLSSGVNNMLYPALGIEKGSIREMLSIPFQQTARYVNHFDEEVTEEERSAIDAVLVYDELDLYTPEVSDAVKGNYKEDSSALPEYFKHWFSMFVKHPVCYFEAAFMLSYGYFAPVKTSLDAYFLSEYYPPLVEMGFYRAFGDFPTRAFDSVRELFIQAPLTNILSMAGFYTWIMMLCFVQLMRKKQFSALLLFIPGIMNILVCIASPLCASTRYELPVIATVPLILGWTILHSKNKGSA